MSDPCDSPTKLEFVLGTAQLTSTYGITRPNGGPPRHHGAIELLQAAVDAEVDALDTAPAYGDAEATIGSSSWAGSVHTKIDPGADPRTSLDRSLALLQRDQVDVLYLHNSAEVLRPDSAVIDAAHRLVGNGVGRLGASIYDVEEFDAAVTDPRIAVIQVPLNVLDRRIDNSRLAAAHKRGVSVYARSVLLQGLLVTPPERVDVLVPGLGPFVEAFQAIARMSGRTPLEVALGWAQATSGIRGVILGAESAEHLHGVMSGFRSEPLEGTVLSELRELEVPERRHIDPRAWRMLP